MLTLTPRFLEFYTKLAELYGARTKIAAVAAGGAHTIERVTDDLYRRLDVRKGFCKCVNVLYNTTSSDFEHAMGILARVIEYYANTGMKALLNKCRVHYGIARDQLTTRNKTMVKKT